MKTLDRSVGRAAFGGDAANYHESRPPYPDDVWTLLRERAGLRSGIDILEIGAGTGRATGPLLAAAPHRLLAVEPDPRLARFLGDTLPDAALEILVEPFETADLPTTSFDLVASATAFHWLDPVPALLRIRGLLKAGGNVALWWNVFGDPDRPDPFHEATVQLFAGHAVSPSEGGGRLSFGLDAAARLADFATASLAPDEPVFVKSTLVLDPPGVRRLYETYSNVNVLPPDDRARLLDGLEQVAEREFGGRVERNLVTAIYTARA